MANANYVKFLRGTPSAYAALETKDNDTLYFIIATGASYGKLYLGDILVAGNVTADGTDIIDSLGELVDVKLSGLKTGQILGFNGTDWVNMDLPSVVEGSVMQGATESTAGVVGYVPAPQAGDQNKFLRGDGTWQNVTAGVVKDSSKYKVTNGLFADTLVNYREEEIRIMFTDSSAFTLQQSGANADPNTYYVGFKAYAPDGATHFKESLAETMTDNTLFDFTGEFAGTDSDGRKYSIVWLPVAKYDSVTSTWTYYGKQSTKDKYIGWFYTVEWYKNGTVIDADTIRINLANSNCFMNNKAYYMGEYVTDLEVEKYEDSITWGFLD